MKKRTIVCRCEDLTEEDVIKAIDEGYADIEELRKRLRIGMGPCQGRVCIQLVVKLLEKKTGKKVKMLPTARPPTIPVSLGALARENHET